MLLCHREPVCETPFLFVTGFFLCAVRDKCVVVVVVTCKGVRAVRSVHRERFRAFSYSSVGSEMARRSAFTVMAALVLLVAAATRLPAGARASALRSSVPADDDDSVHHRSYARHRRDVVGPVAFDAAKTAVAAIAAPGAAAADSAAATVRDKRSFKLLKLKPLITLPAKVALGAGSKLVTGAKLGAKAVRVGAKAVGAGLVGLKAVSKVAKVTVKAATALGIKAALLNFLFHVSSIQAGLKRSKISNELKFFSFFF